jgi:hypothetical protein
MRSLYSRPNRSSIYEPVSVHDISQEVLEKALILLPQSDLISASSACRAAPITGFLRTVVKIKDNKMYPTN